MAWGFVAGLTLIACLALPAARAFAAGGATIATAPSVSYGQQLFGNTATDDGGETLSDCVDGESWWTLPVLAGDQVKIDYEGGLDYMQVWGVGTTDFNIHTAPSPQQFHIGSNDKEESIVKAAIAGSMPMRFYSFDEEGFCIFSGSGDDYVPGPYDFTAVVQHALAAALTPVVGIYTNSIVTGAASLVDGSSLPDGVIFNLVAKWHGSEGPHSVAYSASTTAGSLNFALALPSETVGKTVRIVITRGEDTSYQAVKSVPLKVAVAGVPSVRHHRHRRHHHHHHRRHHHHHHHHHRH
jgi:hypothetical protein